MTSSGLTEDDGPGIAVCPSVPFSDDLVQSYRVLAAAKAPVSTSLRHQGGHERPGEEEDSRGRDDGFHCSGRDLYGCEWAAFVRPDACSPRCRVLHSLPQSCVVMTFLSLLASFSVCSMRVCVRMLVSTHVAMTISFFFKCARASWTRLKLLTACRAQACANLCFTGQTAEL